ncbi:MAG: S-layer homology domain-containing protein [Peptococcaceae bacterium]|nr:S-layer homology domain-containing protein [Peptococcaceae bacterium]
MRKVAKTFIVLTVVCLSVLLAAGSALAMPAWKNNPGAKDNNKMAKARVKVQFVDISGHWAEQSIMLMNAENVIRGYGDNTFQPNKPVSKEEAITMIVRMLNGDNFSSTLRSGKHKNAKGVSWWAGSYLDQAVEKGILSEVELNTMAFNKPAQRYEVTVWLVRALGLESKAIENTGADLDFRDESAIPAWARGYVKVAIDQDIITGLPGRVFQPGTPITRAEMAAMLARARENFEIPSPRQGFSFVQGVITKVDDGDSPSITIKRAFGTRTVVAGELTVDVADEALIYLDGKSAELGDLEKGDKAAVLLNGEKEAIVVMARSTGGSDADENDNDNDNQTVEGIVESVGSLSITVKVDGQLRVYTLDEDVQVEIDGEEADLADIKKGYEVELTLEEGKVTEIEADSGEVQVSGTVESVGDDTITVKVGSVLRVYEVSEDVDVTLDGEDADLDDLEKGYRVKLTIANGEVTEIDADSGTISGVLESVGASSITVKVDGVFKVYSLASGVDVIIDGDEKGLDDLSKGMDVKLTLSNNKVIKIVAEG